MNIVIAGAGDVGYHLTKLLSREDQYITLIDLDEDLLEYVANHFDVRTVLGDATSVEVLEESGVRTAQLFISVTTGQATNLLSASMAKRLGAKKSLARVDNPEYLQGNMVKYFNDLGISSLFSPRDLAVKEIKRLLDRVSVSDVLDFEDGQISILGFTVDNSSSLVGLSFDELNSSDNLGATKLICVLRNGESLMPSEVDYIHRNDHIYFSTNHDDFEHINKRIGKHMREINRVMIIGDSKLALDAAVELEGNYEVKIILEQEKSCKEAAKKLDKALIIQGSPDNFDLLLEEGLSEMDAFIALSKNSETNILSSLTAENEGVYKTIASVKNAAYTHISQNIGVDTIINQKILAANEIFRHVRKGKVEAIASFHGVDGEIIEYVIHKDNQLVKKVLKEIKLPIGCVIAGVIRDGNGIVPNDEFMLRKGDKLVVFTRSRSFKTVENMFK